MQTPMDRYHVKNKPVTHVANVNQSYVRSVVRSFMHPWPGNWVAIGRVVVYYARAVRTYSAGIIRVSTVAVIIFTLHNQ